MVTHAPRRPKVSRRAVAVGLLGLLLAGCAEPAGTPDWTPPGWDDRPGVRLVALDAGAETSLNDLGFVNGRIRNDAAAYQARYVQIPGADEFNKRVDAVIRQPLAGVAVTPEVFPVGSGLGDRGCVTGSISWDADRVLTDPQTAPAGGTGTAITCDVLAAFGSTVAVAIRTVTGAAGVASSDQKVALYVDLATDTVTDSGDLWTPDAASELWIRTVEQLRRDAGGVSTAPITAPPDDQIALAAQAFIDLHEEADGSALLVLPAGIVSPELAGLGIEQTAEPVSVSVDGELLDSWQSETASALKQQRGAPFAGMPAWSPSLPVDCSLLSCVAVTYDDGPGSLTTQLIDTLKAEQAGATFFVQCKNVNLMPDVVKQVAANGYEIGSHTMTHPDLTKLPEDKVKSEVNGCGSIVTGITGKPVTMFRPPYGAVNSTVIAAVGKPAILWSIDTNDWQDPGADALVQRSVPNAKRGDIILFHDTHAGSVQTAEQVIFGLKDRGLTPVTVTQLFSGSVPAGRVSNR